MDERDMTTTRTQTVDKLSSDPYRDAPTAWDDLPIEQKLERAREVIKNLERQIGYLSERVHRDLDRLNEHQHNMATGEIVVPLNSRRGYGIVEGKAEQRAVSGKPWF